LTIVDCRERDFVTLEIASETLKKTNLGIFPNVYSFNPLGRLTEGSKVNIERALAVGQRMGGHMVQVSQWRNS
jgi:riboflavin synthase alpha subunit